MKIKYVPEILILALIWYCALVNYEGFLKMFLIVTGSVSNESGSVLRKEVNDGFEGSATYYYYQIHNDSTKTYRFQQFFDVYEYTPGDKIQLGVVKDGLLDPFPTNFMDFWAPRLLVVFIFILLNIFFITDFITKYRSVN